MRRFYRYLLFFTLFIFGNSALFSQISYGGKPLMNTSDFDPGEVIYLLPPEDALTIEAAKSFRFNSLKKAIQYAVERDVDLSPDFNGGWSYGENMKVWRAHIISPEAYSLGVLFSEYEISDGVRIFIYDESGEHVKGAFTRSNNKDFGTFFVANIPGEQVIIEMQVDNDVLDYGRLRIGSISHAVVPLPAFSSKSDLAIGKSQECELDINCAEGDDWQIIKKSICQITTPRVYCSGALINNTSYNGIPYVLTAEHCVNSDFYAQNTVFTFRYENSECFGDDGSMEKSISGADLVATGDSIDFSLLKLSAAPPREYDLYYAGWDVRERNYNSSASMHHPNVDAMKISFDFDPTADPEKLPGDLNDYVVESNFWIKRWDIGTTEGGSSGSGLFNSAKRLIGVLSGGLAVCGDSLGYNATTGRIIYSLAGNEDDYYSRLYYGWDYYSDPEKQLKKWLDPHNTGQLSIGGFSPMSIDVENRISDHNHLVLYPNPSDGVFTINSPGNEGSEFLLAIYTLSGQLVYSQADVREFPVTVNLGFLETGIYLARLKGQDYSGVSRLVIK